MTEGAKHSVPFFMELFKVHLSGESKEVPNVPLSEAQS